MKRVYILSDNSVGMTFGVGTYLNNLKEALVDAPFKVTFVKIFVRIEHVEVSYDDNSNRCIAIPIAKFNYKSPYYFHNVFYILYPYINRMEDNIIHISYCKGKELLSLLGEYFGFKVLLTWHYSSWVDYFLFEQLDEVFFKFNNQVHLSEKEESYFSLYNEEKKMLEQYCDHIIAVANHSAFFLKKYYTLSNIPISVVYNSLPYNAVEKINDFRSKLHISPNEKIILFVGRIDHNKNLDFLVKAFNIIFENNKDVCLLVVGKGDYDQVFHYAYPNLRNIIFTGFLNKEELESFYQIADIGIIPSKYEEFGYVALEMMMHGIPIIANETSGLCEIIENGVSGVLINMNDNINLLANEIQSLLADEDRRKRYSKNAIKRYFDYFDIDIFKKKMIELYKTI